MGEVVSNSCFEVFDKAEEPERCKCKGIVLNAYNNLRADGLSEYQAIKTVVPVLQYHHPSPFLEARNVVECWVFEQSQSAAH